MHRASAVRAPFIRTAHRDGSPHLSHHAMRPPAEPTQGTDDKMKRVSRVSRVFEAEEHGGVIPGE